MNHITRSNRFAAVVLALGFACLPRLVSAETATEIMTKNYASTRVRDSISSATFELVDKGNTRVRTVTSITKLDSNGVDDKRMVRFLSPADVKGTATLTMEHTGSEDDLWIFLPALEKVRRLVASNKKDAFVGTDFSYGDIIGHRVDDWNHELTGEEVVDGHPCYVMTSVPRSDSVRSDTGYGKRVQWVRKDNFVGIRAEFFDEAGKPLKTYRASDVQLVDPGDGKWQAMHAEMTDVKTGHRTIIRVAEFKTNQGVKDDVFTTRTLQSEL